MTASMSCSVNTRSTSAASARSPWMSGPHLTAQGCPYTRLSRTTGVKPARATRLAVWLPMYPAPPTIRIDTLAPSSPGLGISRSLSDVRDKRRPGTGGQRAGEHDLLAVHTNLAARGACKIVHHVAELERQPGGGRFSHCERAGVSRERIVGCVDGCIETRSPE